MLVSATAGDADRNRILEVRSRRSGLDIRRFQKKGWQLSGKSFQSIGDTIEQWQAC